MSVELLSAAVTITQPSEIAAYAKAFAEIATMAVHGPAAHTLITTAIDALT